MKWKSVWVLLSFGLCVSAQGGIDYTVFSRGGSIAVGGLPVSSTATVTGYGSVLQSYTLSLTFLNPDSVGNITGSLTLPIYTPTPIQPFTISTDFTSTDGGYTYYSNPSFSLPAAPGILIGQNPNTTWGLSLVGDPSSGDENTILSWSLSITAVPEPANVALGIFAGVFVVGGLCRTQRVRNRIRRCWVGVNHWLDAV